MACDLSFIIPNSVRDTRDRVSCVAEVNSAIERVRLYFGSESCIDTRGYEDDNYGFEVPGYNLIFHLNAGYWDVYTCFRYWEYFAMKLDDKGVLRSEARDRAFLVARIFGMEEIWFCDEFHADNCELAGEPDTTFEGWKAFGYSDEDAIVYEFHAQDFVDLHHPSYSGYYVNGDNHIAPIPRLESNVPRTKYHDSFEDYRCSKALTTHLTDISVSVIGISRHRIGMDGMGVTTLVVFHGCPLHCKYCLNKRALSDDGECQRLTPHQLYDKVKVDDLYFQATGGGLTFGGGEPCLQSQFIKQFHDLCDDWQDGDHNRNIWHINIETSLNVDTSHISELIYRVDHWIVDIKDMNPAIYQAYTGCSNKQVIENLKYLIEEKRRVSVRVPLIKGYNTLADVERSVAQLKKMGITDIDKFTYTVKEE